LSLCHLRTAARVVSDPRAFVAEMMKAMEEFNPAKEVPTKVEWKLEVNGDQAIATTVPGSTNVGFLTPAPMHLKKIEGTWRIASVISDENLMKLINVPGSGE
jgi:hypothetical protein